MKTRLISSIVGIIIFILLLLAPSIVFTTAILFVNLLAIYELTRAIKLNKKILLFINYLLVIISYILYYYKFLSLDICYVVLLSYIVVMLITYLLSKNIKISEIYCYGMATIILTSLIILFAFLKDRSIYYFLLVFVIAWSSDIFAYFGGKLFGKNKLAPIVSPNKTIEGSISGILFALIFVIVYSKLIPGELNFNNIELIFIAIIGSVLGQFGDLIASKIKREYDVKDYGNIIPGHGGILDRFDSSMFIAPLIFTIMII